MRTLLLLALIVLPAAAVADETWSGEGTLFDRAGKPLGRYGLTLVRTPVKAGVVRHTVTVELPAGKIREMRCTLTLDGESWTSSCADGRQGGGRCFGDGMCLDYLSGPGGQAFATTIAFDGDDRMRMLRTELVEGEAVRFFRETLRRVSE